MHRGLCREGARASDHRAELGSKRDSGWVVGPAGVHACLECGHSHTETVDEEKGTGLRPRSFCRVSSWKKKQHEHICNLKISLRLLHGKMIQKRQEESRRGSRRTSPGKKGGAQTYMVLSN